MATNYKIERQLQAWKERRVIVGPGVCKVITPEMRAAGVVMVMLQLLEEAYAAGRAEEELRKPRTEVNELKQR